MLPQNSHSLTHRKRTGRHTRNPTLDASQLGGNMDEQGSKSTDISRLPTPCVRHQFRPSEKTFLQKLHVGMGHGKPNRGNSELLIPSRNPPTTISQYSWNWPQRPL